MATWSYSYIAGLPDSAFACVQGSDRFYPHHDSSGSVDLPHLRAALSRIGDPNNEQCGKAHLEAHAQAEGLGGRGKALMPVQAKAVDDDELAAWFAGRASRKLLAIPFGGPIPSPKSRIGVDLDGEWFSENTDLYGRFGELRRNRERLVDWSHAFRPPGPNYGDPTGVMAGVVLGKAVLDDEPEEDGWWEEVWFARGQERVKKVERLVKRGVQLFGSTQPITAKSNPDTGEITEWTYVLQTLTTAPQNTYSTFRAKAVLEGINESGIAVSDDFRSLLAQMRDLDADLRTTSRGEFAAKAGRELSSSNEAEIASAIEEFRSHSDAFVARMGDFLDRIRAKYKKE